MTPSFDLVVDRTALAALLVAPFFGVVLCLVDAEFFPWTGELLTDFLAVLSGGWLGLDCAATFDFVVLLAVGLRVECTVVCRSGEPGPDLLVVRGLCRTELCPRVRALLVVRTDVVLPREDEVLEGAAGRLLGRNGCRVVYVACPAVIELVEDTGAT